MPIAIRCWDGSEFGAADAPMRVIFHRRRALRRLVWAPNELGLARGYVSGDLDFDGDLFEGLRAIEHLLGDVAEPSAEVASSLRRSAVRTALRVGALGPPPPRPAEEAVLHGLRHSRRRDTQAIAHHYDIGNEFYRHVLGEAMTYSCAYWKQEPSPSFGLVEAQRAKFDLIAAKLGLRKGMRVLDVGCGWGSFALHVAARYGVSVVGVTLSQEQADYARHAATAAGLSDRVDIRIQDYRDITDGPFDAIASIGMAEHVGESMLTTYSAALFALLRPQGRLLNHAISHRPSGDRATATSTFIDRYVFPDGELVPVAQMIGVLEDSGFEVRDVESLREHYALTLRAWLRNLEQNWTEAVTASSAARARIWRLYMTGSTLAFESNRMGVNQVLAVKADNQGHSGLPRTRTALPSPETN
ncbi:MAG: cyclopropane-fatty-acyl-phospholipid synthase family protein [Antricoccus sp.]